MIEINSLIINGMSTVDFPFLIAVEEVPGLVMAKKKDMLYKQNHVNGVAVKSINAWDTTPHRFKFYLHEVTRRQLREFKSLFKNQGYFKRYDDPGIHLNYVDVSLSSNPLDEVFGYEVDVEFECEPFEYEEEYTEKLGTKIINHTTAPMYPRIELTGSSSSDLVLSIGKQTLVFKGGFRGTRIVECKHGYQNVTDSLGNLKNNEVRGPFFEILPGEHKVTKSDGFTSIKITNRWGWL